MPLGTTSLPSAEAGLRLQFLATLALDQGGRDYPWYDSCFLRKYRAALRLIEEVKPSRAAEFIRAFAPLQTRPDFKTVPIDRVFDGDVLQEIRSIVRGISPSQFERHEVESFGRLVVHDHPRFNELQRDVQELASELAGERLVPTYNFLSLYDETGVCRPHLDSPLSKWTLDLCIDQSDEWPIHLSQVVPWPMDVRSSGPDWETRICESSALKFDSWKMQPGQAIWFSGSGQWHYRKPLTLPRAFCHLLFFHFTPASMVEHVEPSNWPRLFDLPELDSVVSQAV